MASYFSLIRYVPNLAAGEAVNVGVLIADENRLVVRPLADWQRVRPFAGSQTRHVRRLVEDIAENPSGFFGVAGIKNIDELRTVLARWEYLLQFSDVHVSMESVAYLEQSLPQHVLVEDNLELSADQRRAVVKNALYTAMADAYTLRFDRSARSIVRRGPVVQGRKTRHKVDVGVVNGAVHAAAFALSFATHQIDKQWKDTDAVAFAVEDLPQVKERNALAVLLDSPGLTSEPYERAVRLFADMNVPVIEMASVSDWAHKTMRAIPEPLTH